MKVLCTNAEGTGGVLLYNCMYTAKEVSPTQYVLVEVTGLFEKNRFRVVSNKTGLPGTAGGGGPGLGDGS